MDAAYSAVAYMLRLLKESWLGLQKNGFLIIINMFFKPGKPRPEASPCLVS